MHIFNVSLCGQKILVDTFFLKHSQILFHCLWLLFLFVFLGSCAFARANLDCNPPTPSSHVADVIGINHHTTPCTSHQLMLWPWSSLLNCVQVYIPTLWGGIARNKSMTSYLDQKPNSTF
jgi:hypothetical protein